MKHLVLATVIAAVMLVAPVRAQSGYQLLQQGLSKEQAQGDLKAAIAIYQRIAKEFASDHALSAQALVHLGECYQKLGDAQARQVFERVVREYPDRTAEVAVARTHLGTSAPLQARGDRPVWSGGFVDGFGTISPDGRYLTYTDWSRNAALVVHDLTNGTDRRLADPVGTEGGTQFSTISRDGTEVAYEWLNAAGRYELRTVTLQGSGTPEPKRVLDLDDAREIAPYDWSPDGKWIAVYVTRKDFTGQVAVVRVADRSLRVLKSVEWNAPTRIAFSPDGQYIAYDLAVDDRRLEGHIYVMAVDGTRETVAVDDHSGNAVMGWSPDGKYLLFASDRGGSHNLWAVPMADGKPTAAALLTKRDIGTFWSNGISSNGTMYVWKAASPIYVQVASIDLAAGRLTATPNPADRIFINSRGRPAWSSDGRQIAYESCGSLGGGPCRLFVRSLDSGQIREINTPLLYLQVVNFSPDGRSLLGRANAPRGRSGIYRIDIATGEAALLTTNGINPQWLEPGAVVYQRLNRDTLTFVQRDLASGAEHQVVQIPVTGFRRAALSPDGQSVATIAESKSEYVLSVTSVATGQTRPLLRAPAPATLMGTDGGPEWTRDSRSLVVIKTAAADRTNMELWHVPIDGTARKLDVDLSLWVGGSYRVSPDGRQIVYVAATGRTGEEIWALENFLPTSPSTAPSQASTPRARR